MYKVKWMTPEDLLMVDPTGRGRTFVQAMRESPCTPVPCLFACRDRQQILVEYQTLRTKISRDTPSNLVDWDIQYDAKYGGQGDGFPLSEVQEAYARSYAYADRPYHSRLAIIGRDYLLRRIRDRVARKGFPQLANREYNGKSAALPTMMKKGDFLAETLGMHRYRHLMPMLPGQRSQRNGHRVINQEANANFRYFELELNASREWLKAEFPEYFSAWLNPDSYMNQQLTRYVSGGDLYSVELDYVKCDEHFSFDLAADIILPVYEALIPSETVFCEFAAYIEELFHQELFFGDYVWTGKHNLFSGQGITNDFETIYDVCLQLGALIVNGIDPSGVLQLSCGDDQAVVIRRCSEALACRLYDSMAEEAQLNGHEVSIEKRAIRKNAVAFCKRLWAPGVPYKATQYGMLMKGMYPSVLTLNAVFNPERYHKDPWEEAVCTLQRCDNLWGSPWFVPVVDHIGAYLRNDFRSYNAIPETASELDWWDRVYGKRWTKADSHTATEWRRAKILL